MKSVLFLIFNNETPLLLDRLPYDETGFDIIFVGEATKTFSGREKPLFIKKHWSHFSKFNKLRYICITDLPDPDRTKSFIGTNGIQTNENRWIVEHAMRNYPMRIIDELSVELGGDYKITVADVDEIINTEALKVGPAPNQISRYFLWDFRETIETRGLKDHLFHGPYSILYSTLRESHLNLSDARRVRKRADGVVVGSSIVSYGSLNNLDGSPVYPLKEYPSLSLQLLKDPQQIGWHLANMHGGYKSIMSAKAEMFSHSEYSKLKASDPFEVPDIWDRVNAHIRSVSDEARSRISQNAPIFIVESARNLALYIPS